MRLLRWLLRAVIFFVLFAFALNNGHEVQLKWFFGYEWRAPMVLIILATFVAGCVLGVLGMLPGWWHQRRRAAAATPATTATAAPAAPSRPDDGLMTQSPVDGL